MPSFRSRLRIPVPDGWSVAERLEVASADGGAFVTVTSVAAGACPTSERLAEAHGAELGRQPGYELLGERPARLVGDRDVVLRRYRYTPPEGAPLAHLVAYLVADARAYVAIGTSAAARAAVLEGELLAVLRDLEVAPAQDQAAPVTGGGVAPPAGAGQGWSDVRAHWEEATVAGGGDAATTGLLLTPEELEAASELVGGAGFPYLSEQDRGDLSGADRAAVLRAARRGLWARGLLAGAAGGRPELDPELRLALALALVPDLVVNVQHDGQHLERTVLVANPSHAAAITRPRGPVYELAPFAPAALLSRVAASVAIDDAGAAGGGGGAAVHVSGRAVDRARDLLAAGDPAGAAGQLSDAPALAAAFAGLRSFSRVRTVYREGDLVRGGEVLWADAGAEGLWRFEPVAVDRDDVVLEARPVGLAGLRDELLAILPR